MTTAISADTRDAYLFCFLPLAPHIRHHIHEFCSQLRDTASHYVSTLLFVHRNCCIACILISNIYRVMTHVSIDSSSSQQQTLKIQQEREREGLPQNPAREREGLPQNPAREREGVPQNPTREREGLLQNPAREKRLTQNPAREQ